LDHAATPRSLVIIDPSRRPGPDSTLEEVRTRLIDSATEALLSLGMEIGLEQVKLSDAIVRAGVTRATAYRSLADERLGPQDTLRREVLARLLSRDSRRENRDLVGEAAANVLSERSADLASDDIVARTAVLRALIRAGAEASHTSIASSVERGLLMSSYGALMSQGATGSSWQLERLRTGEQTLLDTFSELYDALIATFQLRLRGSLTNAHFATIIAALAEGLGMRSIVNDHVVGVPLATGPEGECEEWTLQGMGIVALVKAFLEPIDSDDPFVDLARL